MNFDVLGQSELPVWWYLVLAVPFTFLTHVIYSSDLQALLRETRVKILELGRRKGEWIFFLEFGLGLVMLTKSLRWWTNLASDANKALFFFSRIQPLKYCWSGTRWGLERDLFFFGFLKALEGSLSAGLKLKRLKFLMLRSRVPFNKWQQKNSTNPSPQILFIWDIISAGKGLILDLQNFWESAFRYWA